MKETKIYVGLNDSAALKQIFDNGQYISVLGNMVGGYHVPFSFSLVQGGYYHESGKLVQENTLLITLIDVDDSIVDEMAKDLCVFFHQESVLITSSNVETRVIKESLYK